MLLPKLPSEHLVHILGLEISDCVDRHAGTLESTNFFQNKFNHKSDTWIVLVVGFTLLQVNELAWQWPKNDSPKRSEDLLESVVASMLLDDRHHRALEEH